MTPSTSFRRAVAAIGALTLAIASFLAVSTVTGGVAQARESSTDQFPPGGITLLFLSVTAGSGQVVGTTVLSCDPPGGLHPYPASACADLATARGEFIDLPGVPGTSCADFYQPVQATAWGWWRLPTLRFFSNTYGNMCDLYRRTGWVFPLPSTYPPPGTTTTLPHPTTTSWPTPTVPLDPPETTVPNDR